MEIMEINDRLRIPDEEFAWSFVRSGGPGGQNVNKVASKAVLRWDLAASPSISDDVKERFRTANPSRVTTEGEVVISSERTRSQPMNKQDCLDILAALLLAATKVPR